MSPTQGVGGSGGCARPGTNKMGLSLQPGLFLKNVVAKLAEGSSVRSSRPRKQHREDLPADSIVYAKGSNTWEMQPCASAHVSSILVKASIQLKSPVSYLCSRDWLEITALREQSRRGIKNSIQTCQSSPEAYEQSFRWLPPRSRKPGGSLRPQIKQQRQQLGEPG